MDILDGVYSRVSDPQNVGYLDDFTGQNGGYQGSDHYHIPPGM
jgi:hypothetical protein